jgi:predicted ATPase
MVSSYCFRTSAPAWTTGLRSSDSERIGPATGTDCKKSGWRKPVASPSSNYKPEGITMIRKLTFGNKYRCFDAGFSVELRQGLNLLVGDQGCGKSTILDGLSGLHSQAGLVVEKDEGTKSKHFDFVQVNVLFASHGQAVVAMLADLCKSVISDPHTFLLDEPDTGLSVRSCRAVSKFLKMLCARGHQVIASVHNPIVILAATEVYSVEHRKRLLRDAMAG